MSGSLLKSMIAVLALALAASLPAATSTLAQSAQKKQASSYKPLKGKSYYGRRGGYSVRKSDITGNTFRQDPTLHARTSGAPLQSDFFWEAPSPQIGGNTDYMH